MLSWEDVNLDGSEEGLSDAANESSDEFGSDQIYSTYCAHSSVSQSEFTVSDDGNHDDDSDDDAMPLDNVPEDPLEVLETIDTLNDTEDLELELEGDFK